MDHILLNHKTMKTRKVLKKIQKESIRTYCKGKSVSKVKIGKLVHIAQRKETNNKSKPLPSEVKLDGLLELLESNNLTGMSGNGFSVKTKLEALINSNSDKYFVINGVECEPGLLHDQWLLRNYWDEVAKGIQLIRQMVCFKRCILAYKVPKDENRIERENIGFEVCAVPARYPMGEERLLIKQVLGKSLKKEEYSVEVGIMVMNVQTVYQIYCLLTNQYYNSRYVTLADLETGEARVVDVKRGENIKAKLIKFFPRNTETEYYAGSGIMSAHTIDNEESFTDEISFAAIGQGAVISNAVACKGCGMCNRKCSSGVDVKRIVRRREINSQADISDLGIEKCIHCHSCSYFCKAGKDITVYLES